MDQKTVLIVEDEGASRLLYQNALSSEGYRTLCAASGAEALDLLEGEDVHAMVLDIRMPDMHGLELLDHLRLHHQTIPAVICTALTRVSETFEVQAYGVRAILLKPVDLDDLRASLRDVFASPLAEASGESVKDTT